MATLREHILKLKGVSKKNLRPRLSITDPYEKFWPLLDDEKTKILITMMEKTILKENGKLKVNWLELKKLPLDVRKCLMKDLSRNHKIINPKLKYQRSVFKMGINAVSRLIEKEELVCCIVAEDVGNNMLANHLIIMAAIKKIPVVVLPNMRLVTKHLIGFSSAALGIKVDILNVKDHPLYQLYLIIDELAKNYKTPYPNKLINRESKTILKKKVISVDVKNFLLKKPREGRAFVPDNLLSVEKSNDLLFIPIQNSLRLENQMESDYNEKLIDIPPKDLFSVDTTPTIIEEDVGEEVKHTINTNRKPMRYFGLKIKKMKPDTNRKNKIKTK
ncbi:uncharacterized protein LOC126903367 [Daktulosphaira vitifoliae]|uniref:uncharacterized protein LOC126903367 n=1 Tax=Daktulosphaira vitifoliae TaxID=58002 RepID=UPI0021AAC2D3|nr:uncharacterized protein LOC126903367 [Daktulosphaira vitifoliae]